MKPSFAYLVRVFDRFPELAHHLAERHLESDATRKVTFWKDDQQRSRREGAAEPEYTRVEDVEFEFHNARLHDAKQANDRAEMRQKVSDRRQAEREEKGMHHELAPKPEWEVEWGPDEEEEALERLSRLPLWKTMTPQMLDNMMKSIRSNPQVLDAFEAETKNMLQIQEMKGPDGEMPSQDVICGTGWNAEWTVP